MKLILSLTSSFLLLGALLLTAASCGPSEAAVSCTNYCDQSLQTCTEGNAVFGSRAQCNEACARYPQNGEVDDKSGNTLQCRFTHLGFAKTDPNIHCPHTGPEGGGICVDSVTPCDQYCALVQESCALETTRQYPSIEDCLNTCATFRLAVEPMGNTIECRLVVLRNFPGARSPADACVQAGAQSTTCVDAQ